MPITNVREIRYDIAHVDFGNGRTFDIQCTKIKRVDAAPGEKGI
jgi:hypothetical protein